MNVVAISTAEDARETCEVPPPPLRHQDSGFRRQSKKKGRKTSDFGPSTSVEVPRIKISNSHKIISSMPNQPVIDENREEIYDYESEKRTESRDSQSMITITPFQPSVIQEKFELPMKVMVNLHSPRRRRATAGSVLGSQDSLRRIQGARRRASTNSSSTASAPSTSLLSRGLFTHAKVSSISAEDKGTTKPTKRKLSNTTCCIQ